jgi:hypothetical protein
MIARIVARARTMILATVGLGFLCAAAWTVHMSFGLASVGVSLLLLDYALDKGER